MTYLPLKLDELVYIMIPMLNLAFAISFAYTNLMSDVSRYMLTGIHACAVVFVCMLSTMYPMSLYVAVWYWHISTLTLGVIVYILALIRRRRAKNPEPMKMPLLSSGGPEEEMLP